MPCNSDHLRPTEREQENRAVANHMLYVIELARPGLRVPENLRALADDIYAKHDLTAELCELLSILTEEERARIVYNAHDPRSRRLADWWERHLERDRCRLADDLKALHDEKEREAAIAKLTPHERKILGIEE